MTKPALQPVPGVAPALNVPAIPPAAVRGTVPRGRRCRAGPAPGLCPPGQRCPFSSPLPAGTEAPRPAGSLAQAAAHPSALLSHPRLPDYFNEDNDSHLGNSNPLTITILISFHYKSETSSLTFKTLAIGSSVERRGWVGAVGGVGRAPGCRWDGETADGVRAKEPRAEGGTEPAPARPQPTAVCEGIGSSPALQGAWAETRTWCLVALWWHLSCSLGAAAFGDSAGRGGDICHPGRDTYLPHAGHVGLHEKIS